MNISIAIVDVNKEYLRRLAEGLEEYEELSVSIYTDIKLLEKTLETKQFDVILFDPDVSEERLSFHNAKVWMALYSEEARNSVMYRDCDKVIKYQRISKLYKDVIKVYSDKAGYIADFSNLQSTKVVAVYSPIGGAGKTTIALSLANKFQMQGKKVLFMSSEQLDSSSYANPIEETEGITMLIEAAEEASGFELKLNCAIRKEMTGIFFIDGFERIVDYSTVTKEEMAGVVDKIRKYGSYDVVIIDMQSMIDGIGQAILEQADHVVVVERGGEIATRKMELFMRQAIVMEHANKMCTVVNFADANSNRSIMANVPNIGYVHNYLGQMQNNLIQLIVTKENLNTNELLK